MKRYLCWLGLFAVVALPDWATACRPMAAPVQFAEPVWVVPSCPPPFYVVPFCPPPLYLVPFYPPPLFVVPCCPSLPMVFPGPRIEQAPKMAAPGVAPAPGMSGAVPSEIPRQVNPPPRPPSVEQIRPASGITKTGTPSPKPEVKATDPGRPPTNPTKEPESPFPVIEIPKDLQIDPKTLPMEPAKGLDPLPKGNLPPLELPKEPEFRPAPKLPPLELPQDPAAPAIPSPAPPPPSNAIPPPALPIPEPNKPESLPSLTLPPDSPTAPAKGSTSRSSPLNAGSSRELSVSVFPAHAERPVRGQGYRTIGFYNHSARDLKLTLEGRVVKLPANSYLEAKLGQTFNWAHGDHPIARAVVPDGASGLDVVFRE